MSVEAVSWAINKAPVGGNTTARMILVSLADKADDYGRDAWKYVSAIADSIRKSDATVFRTIAWLEEIGVIERGDQHLVDHYPEYARPIVWNLRLDLVQEPTERQKRKGRVGRPRKQVKDPETSDKTDGKTLSQNERGFSEPADKASYATETADTDIDTTAETNENLLTPVTDGPAETPSHQCERVSKSKTSSHQCEEPSLTGETHNVQKHIYPSVPTGHLPASGEPSRADGAETETGNVPTDIGSGPAASMPEPGEPDLPGEVLDALGLTRSRLGLPVERPTDRDRKHAGRLVKRVAEANHGDTAKAMMLILAVIDWMPSHPFWLRRVTNGRSLAANWTSAASDYTVDQLEARQRHEAEARGSDKPKQPRKATPTPHAYTPQPHSARLVAPIFGLRTMTSEGVSQSDIDAHFAGATCLGECPVCRHDPRNRANHGVTASQEAGSVRSRKDREA